jgi:hypothetical protein
MILIKDKMKAADGMLHIKLPDEFKDKTVEVVVKTEEIANKLLSDTIKIDTTRWKFNREEIYNR